MGNEAYVTDERQACIFSDEKGENIWDYGEDLTLILHALLDGFTAACYYVKVGGTF